jgi:protein-L-isoaspartate(D-aspartate) O-methyltransferase
VYSIERHEALAREAGAALAKLGYANLSLIVGDGTEGVVLHAPYDAIVVAAAAPRIPQPLFDQLREGGRMVIPVGPREGQQLQLVRKLGGQPLVTRLGGCAFVPLIGSQGYGSGW